MDVETSEQSVIRFGPLSNHTLERETAEGMLKALFARHKSLFGELMVEAKLGPGLVRKVSASHHAAQNGS